MTDRTLQQFASKFLAQAIVEVFPSAILIDGSYTNVMFHYSAILPQKINDSMISLIEEKMRGLIKASPEFRITEMMAKNAAGYFEYHKQPALAEKAENSLETLIPILELGKFKDFCTPDEIPEEFTPFFFEILNLEQISNEGQWISLFTGTASTEKDAVKKFVKHYKQAQKYDHKLVGADHHLYAQLDSGQWAWLPRGEQIKNTLLQLKINSLKVEVPLNLDPDTLGFPHNLQFDPVPAWHTWLYQNSNFAPSNFTSISQHLSNAPTSELNGFLLNTAYTQDLTHFYRNGADVEKELNYCLQFVGKIFKIFGFEVQWILRTTRPDSKAKASEWDQGVKALTSAAKTLGLNVELSKAQGASNGPKLEALLHDAFGQQWSGPFVQIDCCHPKLKMLASSGKTHPALNTPKMIALSVWGSLERILALLVEQRQGRLQWPAFLDEVQKKMNSINEELVSSIES